MADVQTGRFRFRVFFQVRSIIIFTRVHVRLLFSVEQHSQQMDYWIISVLFFFFSTYNKTVQR